MELGKPINVGTSSCMLFACVSWCWIALPFWGGMGEIFGQKKRGSAESQSFVNLKSNTMKNTMQRYEFLPILPKLYGTSF